MSARLGLRLFELDVKGGRAKRYLACIWRTLPLLWRSRNSLVFVQNPSLVLAALAVACRPLFRYRVVIDAHNAGIFPPGGNDSMPQKFADWLARRADVVIVTNRGLASHVRKVGGQPFVLPDPLPNIRAVVERPNETPQVLFVCTWAADEPYVEVFKAAKMLPDVKILVTGNSKGREKELGESLPSNVTLTGFLPHQDYEALLASSEVILDLTTRSDCLVCGAYEAVAVGRPFVLSDTEALRSHFSIGGMHIRNDASGIADGVSRVLANYERYRKDVVSLKAQLEADWLERKKSLVSQLGVAASDST